ncbi:MAG: SufD family Fe-S cluster assembly protein, partial [Actinomycetia bacterium]|nr:SufD family Fe-S cluster assembly protein [Actinomycetes bacterium]
KVRQGLHAGISEFYVGKGAKLTFTMIHNWAEEFDVRPRTAIIVEEDATYVNNYVLMKPVKSIQSFPSARLVGDRSRAVFNSIVYGLADSTIDIGSESIMEGEGSRSEAVARTVTRGRSIVYSRGRLIGRTNDCKAHLDCRGMVQSDESTQWAIPDLVSEGAPGAELSHEAAISPIAAEEVFYLMSRGIPKDEAISMITRGFLDLDIPGLPPALRRQIDDALFETAKDSM